MSALQRLNEQRRAADPSVSAWVTANAGSGKTAVLVDRIIRLLLNGAEPSRLLCLTYTRGAAAEMSERLNERLGAWAMQDDSGVRADLLAMEGVSPDSKTIARARSLFALALETPGGLKIQTIHAFCEALLGRFPLEAGVPPHFSILDDRTARELAASIRERILNSAAANEDSALAAAIARIAQLGGDGAIDTIFDALKSRRRKWKGVSEGKEVLELRVECLRARLGLAPDETEAAIREQILEFPTRFQLKRIAQALLKGGATSQKRGQELAAALSGTNVETLMSAIISVCLTGDGEPRKSPLDKAAQKADPGTVELIDAATQALLALIERLNAAFIAEATAQVYVIAEPFFEQYEREKASRGLLDYDDLIEKAERLLTKSRMATWVLYKLDGGIDHILIDEAQDTSPEQWNIVGAIAEEFFAGLGRDAPGGAHRPRTIFAVGDLKQSIYSFQGADPESFLRMRAKMRAQAQDAGQEFDPVALHMSFRTAAPPLALVDAVFAHGSARNGVAQDDEPVVHKIARVGAAGRVELWPSVKPTKADDVDDAWDAPMDRLSDAHPAVQLGGLIAERVAGWISSGEMLTSQGRPIQPDDIMILVRRRNVLTEEIIRQLKQRGVAVSGADRLVLMNHMASQDLLALGQFALNPYDDLNLGGLLKSPLIGLTEEQLFDVAYGRPGSLWEAVRQKQNEPRFADAYKKLVGATGRADFVPPFEFFANELGPNGGRKRLVQRLGKDANDPINEFLNLALTFEHVHAPSLQKFVDWLVRGDTQIKRDLDRGGGMVRVMTVHGAKGLEGNIVILPDTCQVPPKSRREPLLDAGNGVLLWSVDGKRDCVARTELLERVREKEMQEYHRLLYVALTRARDRVYVCGYENKRGGRENGCWYNAVDEAMRRMDARQEPFNVTENALVIEATQTAAIPAAKVSAIRSASVTLPEWVRRPIVSTAPEAKARPSSRGRGGDTEALLLGEIVHALLMRLGGAANVPSDATVLAWAQAMGAPAAMAKVAAGQALAVRFGVDFSDIFDPHSRGELPFDVEHKHRAQRINGRFDRLVLTSNEVRVVEFKTTGRVPPSPGDIDPRQGRQIGQYAYAAGVLFPTRTVIAEIIWTAGPTRMVIPSPLLEVWGSAP